MNKEVEEKVVATEEVVVEETTAAEVKESFVKKVWGKVKKPLMLIGGLTLVGGASYGLGYAVGSKKTDVADDSSLSSEVSEEE